MTGPRVDVPTPQPVSLEGVLAQRANEAMQQGADPKAATDILGKMVAHLRANPDFAKQGEAALANGATPSDVAGIVWQHVNAPKPQEPGFVQRVASGVGNAVGGAVRDPVGTLKGMGKSFLHDLDVAGQGMDAGMGQPNALTPAMAKEVPGALARTATTVAFPEIASGVTKAVAARGVGGALSRAAGLTAAGAPAGAASDPEHPGSGAVTGGLLANLFGAAAHGTGEVAKGVGSTVMDYAGRPAESRPLISAGPIKVGQVEGMTDRAARLNASGLKSAPLAAPDATAKPLAPVDVGGIPAQRMARGLKTSSPGAEAAMRGVLEPRADESVTRVIDQAKQLAGVQRANAYETHQQLMDRIAEESNAGYGKVWDAEKARGSVEHPDLESVLERPSVKKALPIAAEMQADNGVQKGPTRPAGIPDDQWALLKQAASRQGLTLPEGDASGYTLQDLHNAKLALDDMKRPGYDRGAMQGGVGYNRARSINAAQKALLSVMDAWSPAYKAIRAKTADNMSLKDASTAGQEHWSRDPAESAAMLKDMTPAEQTLYRSQAFDKWAERVENGPEDISKAQSKPLNQKRLRLLFPDDASFATFKDGLAQEAQMHATNKTVLSGSNTADKLSDMAHDAGVTLPDVMKILGGRPLSAARDIVGRGLRNAKSQSSERLAVERANLLTAGANGDATARTSAVQKMQGVPPKKPAVGRGSIMAAVSGATTSPEKP